MLKKKVIDVILHFLLIKINILFFLYRYRLILKYSPYFIVKKKFPLLLLPYLNLTLKIVQNNVDEKAKTT